MCIAGFLPTPLSIRQYQQEGSNMLDRSMAGKRIRLISTTDPHTNLRQGDEGTAQFIDAIGTLAVKWDNGSSLGLIPGFDHWTEVPGE